MPVVTVVSTAPAFAAVSTTANPPTATYTSPPLRTTPPGGALQNLLTLTLSVCNQGAATISRPTVTVMVVPDTNNGVGMFNRSTTTTPTGWTVSELSGGSTDTSSTYTFVYIYNGDIAPGSCVPLSPQITLAPLADAGIVNTTTYGSTQSQPGSTTSVSFA